MDKPVTFQATIEIIGINPYVLVSREQASSLQPNWRKPMPVSVQINGKPELPWHINMMPAGDGSFYLYLHNSVRQASHTRVGDTVTVSVAFDSSYTNGPQHPLPAWFKTPLQRDKTSLRNWSSLPPSRQKEILRYFTGLKSDEARQRNLEKVMHVLQGHSDRFMGRDWTNGS